MEDLYDYQGKFIALQNRINESKISDSDKKTIKAFQTDCQLKGKSELPTLLRTCELLLIVALKHSKKDFRKFKKEDFEDVVQQIENRKELSIATKAKYRTILKKFGSWLAYGDKIFNGYRHKYPGTVEWIRTGIRKKDVPKIKASDILTEEEVTKLINAADHPRDKAFISILYETGARISEIGKIKIKNITEQPHGYLIDLAKGKTGERNCVIVFSASKLSQWLNQHPLNHDKNSYVWCGMQDDKRQEKVRGDPLSYKGLAKIIERAKDKCGIKKRINPHLFRHSRVTHLLINSQINESQAKIYFGWAPDSKMIAQYSHLSSADANRAILAVNGFREGEEKTGGIKSRICPNCNKPNAPSDNFCGFCSRPLDFKTMIKQDSDIKATMQSVLSTAKLKDQIREELLQQIKKEIKEELGLK